MPAILSIVTSVSIRRIMCAPNTGAVRGVSCCIVHLQSSHSQWELKCGWVAPTLPGCDETMPADHLKAKLQPEQQEYCMHGISIVLHVFPRTGQEYFIVLQEYFKSRAGVFQEYCVVFEEFCMYCKYTQFFCMAARSISAVL